MMRSRGRKPYAVISVAGIRTVAPPERRQPAPAEGLYVGTFSTGALPFQLDEQDPIFEGNGAITATKNNPTATAPAVVDKDAPLTQLPVDTSSTATTIQDENSDSKKKAEESAIQIQILDQDDNHANMMQEARGKGNVAQGDLGGDHDNRNSKSDLEPDLQRTSDSSDDEYFETQKTGRTLRDEETVLLDRIDVNITRAEEDLMDKVDQEISRAEEKDLLDRVLYNIEQAEVLERARSKPSLVTDVDDCNDPERVITDSWQLPPPVKRRRKFRTRKISVFRDVTSLDSYNRFKEKIKPIVEIDYKGVDARTITKVISSMWSQHNLLLGNDVMCDEKCECLLRLPNLVNNVTKDYGADQKKKGYSIDESSLKSAGFALYFAPRFLPLLVKEYPNSTPPQHIHRLVDMWTVHQKQRMNGIRCYQDCDYPEAWQLFFGKGKRRNAEISSKSQKRNTATTIPPKRTHVSESSTVQSEQPRTSIATIPRIPKANRPEKNLSLVASNKAGSERSAPWAKPRKPKLPQPKSRSSILASCEVDHHRPAGSTNAVPRKQKMMAKEKQLSPVAHYPLRLDTFAPLRAYFVAGIGQAGSRRKIHSIVEKGQEKRDRRIRPGTIADSATVGRGERHKINKPSQLKKVYESARKTKSKLHFNLENSQVSDSNMNVGIVDKNWSHSGTRRRTFNHGWSDCASTLEAKMRPGLNVPPPDVPQRRSSHSLRAPFEVHRGVVVEWKKVTSSAVPKHRTSRPSKSVKRVVAHSRQNDKPDNFVKEFETREFNHSKNAADCWQVNILRPSTAESEYSVPIQSLEEAFVGAVRQRACKDLVQVLEQGAASDKTAVESMQAEYDRLKDTMGSVERGSKGGPSDSLLLQRQCDLNAKKIVLKVYIRTADCIERAMGLRNWKRFEIRVRCIELGKTSSIDVRGRTDVLVGKVRTEVQGAPGQSHSHLGELPPRRPTECIMYTDTDDDHVPVFEVKNNSGLSQKQVHFVIEIEVGLGEDSVPPMKLGHFSIPLNQIDQQCPNDWSLITIPQLASTNERLIKSKVEIEVRRLKVDRRLKVGSKFIQAKIQEVERRVDEQINTITRFNEKEGVAASCKLTGNISGHGGFTLLHAAIQLKMEAAAKKLVELGANPLQPSVDGTPLSMAEENENVAWKKLMKRRTEEPRDELAITKREEVHEIYQRVVDLLRRTDS